MIEGNQVRSRREKNVRANKAGYIRQQNKKKKRKKNRKKNRSRARRTFRKELEYCTSMLQVRLVNSLVFPRWITILIRADRYQR